MTFQKYVESINDVSISPLVVVSILLRCKTNASASTSNMTSKFSNMFAII